MKFWTKFLWILLAVKCSKTTSVGHLENLLNELGQYLAEMERYGHASQDMSQDISDNEKDEYSIKVNQRLPPLPWNKRLPPLPLNRLSRKRPLPPLPWNKRQDIETGNELKDLMELVSDLEYQGKNKRLPSIPLNNRLPPLLPNKRLSLLPQRIRMDEDLEMEKRLPPLPWNKRLNLDAEDDGYATKVKSLLEIVKKLKNRLLDPDLDKRLPPLPTNKRQSNTAKDLIRILHPF